MRILGTLTHRADHNDWLLRLDSGYTDLITGSPPPNNGDYWQIMPALAVAIGAIASRERIDDVDIRVIDPFGTDIIGQHQPGGLVIGALRVLDGQVTPMVSRSPGAPT